MEKCPQQDGLNPTSGQYEGQALITSVSLNTPHDGDATMSVSMRGVKGLTIASGS